MMLAIFICIVILLVGALDWVAFRRSNRRVLSLELLGFSVVFVLSMKPDWFNHLAQSVGIGRGVDLLTYPMLIWLFREAVVGRVRYRKQRDEITQLVRALAVNSQTSVGGKP
jgi:small membrane protein